MVFSGESQISVLAGIIAAGRKAAVSGSDAGEMSSALAELATNDSRNMVDNIVTA